MKTLLLIINLFAISGLNSNAQVGIGTTTPSTNSALDVTSANKGLMLPRINDTTSVSNPSAGLVIYNRHTQAPAYHNGTRWNTLAAKTTSTTGTTGTTGTNGASGAAARPDSVTYTLTGAFSPYTNGTFSTVSTISSGTSNTYNSSGPIPGYGRATFENVVISKAVDANSVAIVRNINTGQISSTNTTMEFKVFAAGASTPYYSIKVSAPHFLAYHVSLDAHGQLMEQITLTADVYGYKNWVTGQSYAVNILNRNNPPY